MRTEAEGKGDKQSMLRKVLCREDYGEESVKKKEKALWRSEIKGNPRVASCMPL